jgi:DNA-binding transcriptional ArsR family regulator
MHGLRIPDTVLLDRQLAPSARVLYGLLAASGPSFNPANSQIEGSLGMGWRRIDQARRALEERGLVTLTRPTEKDRRRRYTEPIRYAVHAGQGQDVWVRPGRVRSLVQAMPKRSRVLALLLHVYERRAVRLDQPQPSIAQTAADLGVSIASVKRA